MTVSSQTPINRSTGNGVTTVFPYTFKIISAADIEVTVDDVVKTLNVDYTVSGAGVNAGGNVTMTVAPANLSSVVRRRSMALVRTTDYQDQGELPAATLDDDLDSAVLMIQQVDEQIGRALTLPSGVVGVSAELPTPVINGLLGWNSAGDAIVNYTGTASSLVSAAMAPVVAGSDLATARAAMGAAESGANTDITSLGAVTGVTASNGDNSTKLATTAFVAANARSAGLFYKDSTTSVAFTKTAANTASIKAGTIVDVLGVSVTFTAATAIVMPTLTAGTDYAIYACQDGTVRADSSFTAPSGYTVANSRLIGGFHYGLVASGTTVAGGSFNSAGSVQTGGMVWTQTDVDNIAGINLFSFWDLKWRANVSDLRAQKGFVLTGAGTWVAIYFAGTDTDTNGLSRNNVAVASGTVLAKIPTTMGGNGTLTYADYTWWRASEHARAHGARLLTDAEANIAFFGVTENQSLGGAASTIPLTTRAAGYTSKYGIEQATGHHWVWGDDSSGTTASGFVANGGRGQSYTSGTTKVILGGSRGDAAISGSRTSNWGSGPTNSNWVFGLRAACDHLMLV